jgi:hypothetical protein
MLFHIAPCLQAGGGFEGETATVADAPGTPVTVTEVMQGDLRKRFSSMPYLPSSSKHL